jgi:hypothetical protein
MGLAAASGGAGRDRDAHGDARLSRLPYDCCRLEEGGPMVQGVRCGAGREEAWLRVDVFSAAVDTRVPCRGTGL